MGKDTKPILSKMKKCDRIHFAFPAVASLVLFITGICLIIFNPSNRTIWLAMILAPFGGLSRHFLGMYLNGWKRYPLGTFLANLFGSLILTVLTVTRISLSSSNETDNIEWNPIEEIMSTPGMRFYLRNELLTEGCVFLVVISVWISLETTTIETVHPSLQVHRNQTSKINRMKR